MFFFNHLVSCEVVNLEFSSSVQGDGVTALMHAAGEDHADAVEAIFGMKSSRNVWIWGQGKMVGTSTGGSFQSIPKSNLRAVTSRI